MERQLIYDVGMYDGADTALYLSRGYRVLAIEANPRMVELAQRRFAGAVKVGRLVILPVAVADRWGTGKLWVAEEKLDWSTLDPQTFPRKDVPAKTVDVQLRPFSSILEEYGVPYYLKVDIQGNEHLVLDALAADDLPQYCSFELPRGPDVGAVLTAQDKGFSGFKIISQQDFSALDFHPYELGPTIRRLIRVDSRPLNALEYHPDELVGLVKRKLVDRPQAMHALTTALWRFSKGQRANGNIGREADYTPGSSGPFGEDTPGPWVQPHQVMFTWIAFCLGHTRRRYGQDLWHDVHCRR